jgi:outer membrane autotransporter protein
MKLGALESEEERIVNEGYHPRTWRLWTTGFGGTSSLDGSLAAGRADMKSTTGGVGVGLDYQIDRSTLVGIAGGYTYSSFSVDQLSTDGSVQGGHAGLYAVKRYGPMYVAGLVDYAHFSNETDRNINWVVDETASGDFGSDVYGARTEAGWRYSTGRHNVTPFAGLDMVTIRTDGYVEDSVGILGLTFESGRATSLTSALGAQYDTWVQLDNGQILRPFARVAWVHEFFPDLGVDSLLTISPAATFAGEGIFAAEDVARVNTGFGLELTEHTGLFAYFDGEFSGYSQSYAGNGGVKVSW